MKFLKLFISSFFIFVSLLVAPIIFAEEVKNNEIKKSTDSITVIAEVNIQNFKIISQEGNVFKISFDLTNGMGVQSGVKYGIKLVGQNDKGKFVVDEKVYPEEITLYEKSKVSKEITYTAPGSMGGKFVLMVESKNSSGFPFAISYSNEIILTPKTEGVVIFSNTCKLSIKDEKPSKTYTLSQGVDINLGEILVLSCDVQNFSDKEITVIPNYETTYRTAYGNIVPGEGGTSESVILKSQERKNLLLELPKAKSPQAYDVKVSLKNGEEVSNSVSIHYVIRGNSATINNITLDKDYYTKGDIAQLSFVWSGQADIFPGNRSGIKGFNQNIVTTQIFNNKGKECSDKVEQSINTGSPNPIIEIPINIKSNCANPTVNLTLKDSNGNVIAEQSLPFKTNQNNTKNIYLLSCIIAVLIVVGLVIFIKIKKNKIKINKLKAIPSHMILPFFILIALGSIFPHFAQADTFILGDVNGVHANFVVNGPSNYQQVSKNEVINFTASVTMTACENAGNLSSTATITYNGNSQNILDTTSSITAPSTDGNYSYTLNFTYNSGDFNLASSVTRSFYISTVSNPTGYDGVCQPIQNSPYICYNMYEGVTAINKTKTPEGDDATVSTNWTWKCKATDSDHTDSETCTLNSTPQNGYCLSDPNWDYNSYDKNDPGCYPGKKITLPNTDVQNYQCVGLYGGTTATCTAPIVAKCNLATVGGCIDGQESSDSRYVYGGQVSWRCENTNSSIYCGPTNIGDTFIASIPDAYCPIHTEDYSCVINAYWKYYNNSGDHNFKVCGTDPSKCVSMNTDTYGNEGNEQMGIMYAYGSDLGNTTSDISIRSTSDQVYDSKTISPYCEYSYDGVNAVYGPARWNGSKCVRDGGWTNPSDWSACSVNYCTYGQTGIIKGEKTRTRSCTNPAPSASGNACVGSATETQECSIDCGGVTSLNFPSSPKIEIEGGTGNENSVTLATGQPQTFYFYSSDYETDPNNEKIRYGIDWDYYDSANPLYGWYPYQWKYLANGYQQQGYSSTYGDGLYKNEISDNWSPEPVGTSLRFTFPTNSQYYKKEQNRGVFTHTWNKAGKYILRGIAANYASPAVYSKSWTPFTVNVVAGAWLNLTTANPTIAKGSTANLKWESGYMESCSADFKPAVNFLGDNYIKPDGTSKYIVDLNANGWVKPDVTTTYSITCIPNAMVSDKTPIKKSITIKVSEDDDKPIIVELTPKTKTIVEGERVDFNWSVASGNASGGCEIPNNIGRKDQSGSFYDNPTTTREYTVTCYKLGYEKNPTMPNGSGSATSKITVLSLCTDPLTCDSFCQIEANKTDLRCTTPPIKPKPVIKEI